MSEQTESEGHQDIAHPGPQCQAPCRPVAFSAYLPSSPAPLHPTPTVYVGSYSLLRPLPLDPDLPDLESFSPEQH